MVEQFGYEESQAGESPVLRALLPDDPVVYVDVGAGEYMDWNSTWLFYKAGGCGLLIEPRKEMLDDYKIHRPEDTVCPVAAYNTSGTMELRLAGGGSSLREGWPIDAIATGWQTVSVEPMWSILRRYPGIRKLCRFCSVDVEGAEREVLESVDWDTFRPEVLMVEYIRFDRHGIGDDISGEWVEIVESAGYREACRSWLNIIYVRADLWKQWEDVRCEVTMPHRTLEETRQHYKDRYGLIQ
jgi:hypothetical protein